MSATIHCFKCAWQSNQRWRKWLFSVALLSAQQFPREDQPKMKNKKNPMALQTGPSMTPHSVVLMGHKWGKTLITSLFLLHTSWLTLFGQLFCLIPPLCTLSSLFSCSAAGGSRSNGSSSSSVTATGRRPRQVIPFTLFREQPRASHSPRERREGGREEAGWGGCGGVTPVPVCCACVSVWFVRGRGRQTDTPREGRECFLSCSTAAQSAPHLHFF